MSVQEGVKAACLPCSIGHFSTSAGLLNEAYRFRNEGLTSPEILDRIADVIEEQNSLERVDLSPEKLGNLQDWEKDLAEEALMKSRELRHKLENIQSIEELRGIAADTETYYKHLNREYNTQRLTECPTCKIMPSAEPNSEPEKPQSTPYEYGKTVSEARQRLLEEIRHARGE